MSADTGSEKPGRQRKIRKETSECEVRAGLIWTESTMGLGASYTAVEVCWVTTQSRLQPAEMDHVLVLRLGQGSLNNLLDGCLWFTCDGEGSVTCCSIFGMLGVVTVG